MRAKQANARAVIMVARRAKPNFTEGPIFWRLFFFTVPIILTGLLQVMYNMADNIVVGRFSGDEQALAAIGQTGTFNTFIVNTFIGLSSGAGIVAAQLFGANRRRELSRSIHTATLFSIISGLALCALALIVARPMLSLMVKPELLDKSTLYILVICAGYPALSIYNTGAAIVRSLGDSRTPLIILALSGLSNVLMNLLFVIVFRMSIVGVALATVISQYAAAAAVLVLMMRQTDEGCTLHIGELRIDRGMLKRILSLGVPASIQSGVFSISNMMLTSAISTFPVETISGNTIAGNLDNVTYTCMNSFSSSVMTFAGQNYGAMKRDRIWRVFIYSLIQVTVIGIFIAQTELLFAHPLASLFVDAKAEAKELIIEQAIIVMNVILNFYFLCGIYGVLAGFIRGLGNSTGPMITAVSTVLAVRSIWIYVFFPMHRDRIDWLLLCYPITWIITVLMNCIILVFTAKKLKFGKKDAEAEPHKI